MGEGRRRKLAGDPPKGPKREKHLRRRISNDLLGGTEFATMAALLMRLNMRTRYPASSFINKTHGENPQ